MRYATTIAGADDDDVMLGDIFCLDSDCAFGRDAVKALKLVFTANGSPAVFKTAVDEVVARADAHEKATHWPFSSYCCQWKTIGLDAYRITAGIAPGMTPGPPPPPPTLSDTVEKVLKVAAWLALVIGVGYAASFAFQLNTAAALRRLARRDDEPRASPRHPAFAREAAQARGLPVRRPPRAARGPRPRFTSPSKVRSVISGPRWR